jgi:hypothetical protein
MGATGAAIGVIGAASSAPASGADASVPCADAGAGGASSNVTSARQTRTIGIG